MKCIIETEGKYIRRMPKILMHAMLKVNFVETFMCMVYIKLFACHFENTTYSSFYG
jgi:hypothetical protein